MEDPEATNSLLFAKTTDGANKNISCRDLEWCTCWNIEDLSCLAWMNEFVQILCWRRSCELFISFCDILVLSFWIWSIENMLRSNYYWRSLNFAWFSEENNWKSCICCSLELPLLDMKHRGMCWKVIMAGEVLVLFCLVLGVENDWKSYVHDVSLWIMLVQSTYVIYEIVLNFRKASMRNLRDPWWRDGGHSLTSRERTRLSGTVFK